MDHLIHSPKILGLVIQSERKAKKINQKQAGKAFRLDQTTISSIEQGALGTRLETIFRLLAALNLEMIIRPKKGFKKNGDGW